MWPLGRRLVAWCALRMRHRQAGCWIGGGDGDGDGRGSSGTRWGLRGLEQLLGRDRHQRRLGRCGPCGARLRTGRAACRMGAAGRALCGSAFRSRWGAGGRARCGTRRRGSWGPDREAGAHYSRPRTLAPSREWAWGSPRWPAPLSTTAGGGSAAESALGEFLVDGPFN